MINKLIAWLFPPKKDGDDDLLNKWGLHSAIIRKYYGDDFSVKPKIPCFWDSFSATIGWYETDESLRVRILEHYTEGSRHE